ncbi:molybdopterin-dependent oxidoreductase [Lyngbya aestuarii]|uniref:molybdopterin-dependent oxidoreductase n=1 Tax=Lyngbya aestuarii TaxID=118322 RepID=UPI00403E2B9B
MKNLFNHLLLCRKKSKAGSKRAFPCAFFTFACFQLSVSLSGCSNLPTETKLEAWRIEASNLNAQMIATQKPEEIQQQWELTIQGQTAKGEPVNLSWPELETLANSSINTKEPHNSSDLEQVIKFRGIAASTLLDQFGAAPQVAEVTFVAHDDYRATVSLADLRQYPILLALERNGQKISRSKGGPLYLVFPYDKYPQLQVKYPDRFWAFYLTDMVVGTEPIQLKVGGRLFDADTLKKLPQATLNEAVAYRIGWPVGKTKLYGVHVRDALAAAGVKIPENGAVIVKGKSPIYRNPANPIRLEASDVKNCDILLATHWGDNQMPIPAKMGGPLTLAFSPDCQTQSENRHWVTFVEELEVTQ